MNIFRKKLKLSQTFLNVLFNLTFIFIFKFLQNTKNTDYLFGLFDSLHLPFHVDADLTKKPTLFDMVDGALNILERDDKGYFLFIEGMCNCNIFRPIQIPYEF